MKSVRNHLSIARAPVGRKSSTGRDGWCRAAAAIPSTKPPSPRLKEPKRLPTCCAEDFLAKSARPATTMKSMDGRRVQGAWKVPLFNCTVLCLSRLNCSSGGNEATSVGCPSFSLSTASYHFKLDLIKLFTNFTIFLSMCHKILTNFIQQSLNYRLPSSARQQSLCTKMQLWGKTNSRAENFPLSRCFLFTYQQEKTWTWKRSKNSFSFSPQANFGRRKFSLLFGRFFVDEIFRSHTNTHFSFQASHGIDKTFGASGDCTVSIRRKFRVTRISR